MKLRALVSAASIALLGSVCFTPSSRADALPGMSWRLVAPEPAPGVAHRLPLGRTSAPKFVAPNRAVISVEGSSGVPKGIWIYDGNGWRALATVCGSTPERAAVAWASPSEFWAVADPAPDPLAPGIDPIARTAQPRDEGTTLCRFKDGELIASYAVPLSSPRRWHPMTSAACNDPSDCWFAGIAATNVDGGEGTFQLHWDGVEPTIVWGAQGRGASDLEPFGGRMWQSSYWGRRADRREQPLLRQAEPRARLLRTVTTAGDTVDPWTSRPRPLAGAVCDGESCPANDEDQLDALDSDGTRLWAVGGGSSSGSAKGRKWGQRVYPVQDDAQNFINPRGPLAAVLTPSGWDELRFDLDAERAAFVFDEHFSSVAAIPGRPDEAWVAVERHEQLGLFFSDAGEYSIERARYVTATPKVARIEYLPGRAAEEVNAVVHEVVTLDAGEGMGSARHVECPAANDCWLMTSEGWPFHWTTTAAADPRKPTDGVADPAPAFPRVIGERPLDGRSPQPTRDDLPEDDSQRFAPRPPVVEIPAPPPGAVVPTDPRTLRLAPLVTGIRALPLRGTTLRLRFELARPARIAIVARRGARTQRGPARRLDPGDQLLSLRIDRARPPRRVTLAAHELAPTAPTLRVRARRARPDRLALTAAPPAAGRLTADVRDAAGRLLGSARMTRAAGGAARLVVRADPARAEREVVARIAWQADDPAARPRLLGWVLRTTLPGTEPVREARRGAGRRAAGRRGAARHAGAPGAARPLGSDR